MAKIMALAGSNSSTSINYKLVKYTTLALQKHNVQLIDMAKMSFPIYSEDYEKEHGFSNSLVELKEAIRNTCLLYTSPSPRDRTRSRMPSSA